MNNRFKFRVWDKNEKILHYDAEKTYDFMRGVPVICKGSFGELLNDDNYIVEQCTGLKDRSGKLIFEGDILYNFGYGKREVIFDSMTASFMLRSLSPIPVEGMEDIFMTWFFSQEIISEYYIIGNIHEMEVKQ